MWRRLNEFMNPTCQLSVMQTGGTSVTVLHLLENVDNLFEPPLYLPSFLIVRICSSKIMQLIFGWHKTDPRNIWLTAKYVIGAPLS